ncbi:MAG TPA: class I SAM-dependent methyltransferase [Chloroflexota bacterium]|nr:class I SAM-dependent methyltransferase [Chloroflexota bacterium]
MIQHELHDHEHGPSHEHEHEHRGHDWHSDAYSREWMERWARRPSREEQFTAAIRLLPFAPDDHFVLMDVGAGYGAFAAFVLERFPKAEAILVDYAQPMLDLAREQQQAFAGRMLFERVDLSEPHCLQSFRDAGVNVAVSAIAIHNLREPRTIQRVYGEVAGVLSAPGYFINLDYVLASSPEADLYYRQMEARADPSKADRVGRRPNFPGTASEQLAWLSAAGFNWTDIPWKQGSLALLLAVKGS